MPWQAQAIRSGVWPMLQMVTGGLVGAQGEGAATKLYKNPIQAQSEPTRAMAIDGASFHARTGRRQV